MTGRYLRGEPEAEAAMLKLYRQLDEHIGWLREHAPDALVAVISDHGQCEEQVVLRVNSVLQDAGLVRELRSADAAASPFFVDRRSERQGQIKLPPAIGRYRRNERMWRLGLAAKRALARRGLSVTAASPHVDRLGSRAFSPTDASFAVYVNHPVDDDLERAREALLGIQLEDGRQAIEGVWTMEELFGHARTGDLEPALFFSPALGVRPSSALKRPILRYRTEGRGTHQRDGIAILHGGPVAAGALEPASICDLAPTLLWAMEAGIPIDGDGRILFEAFEPEFATTQPVREIDEPFVAFHELADSDSSEVNRRLRELGYI
jgi:predicted AlkP superfamily phosphohydrolase/phosphomutase